MALALLGAAACTKPAAPTWQEAAESTYPDIYDGAVTLSAGFYEGSPYAPGGASRRGSIPGRTEVRAASRAAPDAAPGISAALAAEDDRTPGRSRGAAP